MRALALEESSPPATVDTRVVFKLGQWLRYIDDFDGARARLEQAEQQAREEGDESSLANILLNRVIVATWAGDLAGAAELAERMLDAFGQHGVGPEAGDIWRAYVDAYAGRVEPVREAAAKADPEEPIGDGALEPLPGTRRARGRRDGLRRPAPDGGARGVRTRRLPRAGDLAGRRRRDRSGARGRRPRPGGGAARPLRRARGPFANPVEPRGLGAVPRPGARGAGRARRGRGGSRARARRARALPDALRARTDAARPGPAAAAAEAEAPGATLSGRGA